MHLISPVFKNQQAIPRAYTCFGQGKRPRLLVLKSPKQTKAFAITLLDPDAPRGTWVHWLFANGVVGKNSWGKVAYGAPCPPSGTHQYVFTVYALNSPLHLKKGYDLKTFQHALKGHVIAKASMAGLVKHYSR